MVRDARNWHDCGCAQCLQIEACKRASRPLQAIAACREGLRLRPDAVAVWNNLGPLLRAQGNDGEARQALEQALARAPDYAAASCHLGNLLHTHGEYEAALACDDNALAHAQDAHDMRHRRGVTLPRLNQGQAAACFEAVLAAVPGHAGTAISRIAAAIALGRCDEALRSAKGRIAAAPQDLARGSALPSSRPTGSGPDPARADRRTEPGPCAVARTVERAALCAGAPSRPVDKPWRGLRCRARAPRCWSRR
jgi:tetratricopeptide (TPR) repeat protein